MREPDFEPLKPIFSRSNLGVYFSGTLQFILFLFSRNVSLAVRSEEDLDASTFDLRDGSSSKKERKASAATARFTIYKANKASKKKREKSSAKRERKATKTLAIVLGEYSKP